MALDINQLVSEVQEEIQAQVNERVIARLESARQSAEDRRNAAQADLDLVNAEISARIPQAAEENPESV